MSARVMATPVINAARIVEPVAVVYRPTDAGWDATSPDLDGWHATAPTPRMLRTRVEEEVRFALNRPHVRIAHLLPLGAAA